MELYGFHNFAWKLWNAHQDFFLFREDCQDKSITATALHNITAFFLFFAFISASLNAMREQILTKKHL